MTNESEDDLVDGLVKDTLEHLELQCADRSLIGHVLGTAMLRHIERELGDADDERCAAFAIAYFFGAMLPASRVAWDTDSFITRRGLRVIDRGSDP